MNRHTEFIASLCVVDHQKPSEPTLLPNAPPLPRLPPGRAVKPLLLVAPVLCLGRS